MPKQPKVPLVVNVDPEVQLMVRRIGLQRMEAGLGYSETTNAAVVSDAVRLLASQSMPKEEDQYLPITDFEKAVLMSRACGLSEGRVMPVASVAGMERRFKEAGRPLPYPKKEVVSESP